MTEAGFEMTQNNTWCHPPPPSLLNFLIPLGQLNFPHVLSKYFLDQADLKCNVRLQ